MPNPWEMDWGGTPIIDDRPQTQRAPWEIDWSGRPKVGRGEAAKEGALKGATFGFRDELAGLSGAAGNLDVLTPPEEVKGPTAAAARLVKPLVAPFVGAARILGEKARTPAIKGDNLPDTVDTRYVSGPVEQTYETARDASRLTQQAAEEQNPEIFKGSEIAGSVLSPINRVAPPLRAATMLGRATKGAAGGAIGSALYGAGEGEGLSDTLNRAQVGATGGALVGAPAGILLGGRSPAAGAALTPGQRAARTAESLDAPLPAGMTSDVMMTQAATAAARQLPIVGQKIDKRAADTVRAAGESVGEIASDMGQGVVDRATSGAMLRPALEGVITNNKSDISSGYNAVRAAINPNAPIAPTNTDRALNAIIAERARAGRLDPQAGLGDIANMVRQGVGFNGLVRAKSDLGHDIAWGNPAPGFDVGDAKRIYAAMKADLANAVRTNVNPGVNPADALAKFTDAEKTAANLIEQNKTLRQVLNIKGDESLVGSLTRAASEKTGNVKLLAQLRSTMPPQEFQQIGAVALSELGHSTKTNDFSLNQFSSNWNKMGDRAKGVLFSPQHRAWLDDIAEMGNFLKGGDQFANTSNTARSGAFMALLGSGGTAAATMYMHGDITPILSLVAAAAGGYGLASALARPAVASSMSQFARTYRAVTREQNPVTISAFRIATRNLASTVGVPPSEFVKRLQAPASGRAEGDQQEVPGRPPQ